MSNDADQVLRLGWLQELNSATKGIRLLAAKSREYFPRGLSEEDTRAVFVEPVLRGLAWDTLDINDVGRESRRGDPLGDMQLLYDSKIAVVIEIKPLDRERLERYLGQLEGDVIDRLIEAGKGRTLEQMNNSQKWNWKHRLKHNGNIFAYGVLTNGRNWSIYDFTSGKPSNYQASRKPVFEFDLIQADDDHLKELPKILGRDRIHSEATKFCMGQS